MADNIEITVTGLTSLIERFGRLPEKLEEYLRAAAKESAEMVTEQEGVSKYPPETAANQPPTPYYVRGKGTQYKNRNAGNSQRYGTQFYVTNQAYSAAIGNRASYARYLGGKNQAQHMARIGWRRLVDVASEKKDEITQIFSAWVAKGIRDLGL